MKHVLIICLVLAVFLGILVGINFLRGGTESAEAGLPYRETALTLAAAMVVGDAVIVRCVHPPGIPWSDDIDGYAQRERPYTIWLRNCHAAIRLVPYFVSVFSHELLHVEHPKWLHAQVYEAEMGYVPIVRTAITKAKRILMQRRTQYKKPLGNLLAD